MGAYYDEIEIEDMVWDDEKRVYHYPCPCGDRFEISKAQLKEYEDIAICPSCSLVIRVIYDPVSLFLDGFFLFLTISQLDYEDYEEEEEDEESSDTASEADEFVDAMDKLKVADE